MNAFQIAGAVMVGLLVLGMVITYIRHARVGVTILEVDIIEQPTPCQPNGENWIECLSTRIVAGEPVTMLVYYPIRVKANLSEKHDADVYRLRVWRILQKAKPNLHLACLDGNIYGVDAVPVEA